MSLKRKLGGLSALLAAGTALVHYGNKVYEEKRGASEPPIDPEDTISYERERYFTWEHGDIYYQVVGEGSPIVLLHEIDPTSSHHEWQEIFEKLAKSHRVYTPDLPGCGLSDKPNMSYTAYVMGTFLSKFLTEVVSEPAIIVATGLSGCAALTAATLSPDKVAQIVLINPPDTDGATTINSTAETKSRAFQVPVYGTAIYHMITGKNQVEYEFANDYFYNSDLIPADLVNLYVQNAINGESGGKYLFASLASGYLEANLAPLLARIEAPLSIIASKEIPGMEERVEKYRELVSPANVEMMSQVLLLPQLEKPQETLDLIKNMIAD